MIGFPNDHPRFILDLNLKFWILDRIYKTIFKIELAFLENYIYKYLRNPTHIIWIHIYQFLWIDIIPNTILSIQNQQYEHVDIAGQYPIKL